MTTTHTPVTLPPPPPQGGCEDYIHRIGRTGRAGAKGEAYTLFTHDDGKFARELMEIMQEADQMVPPELHQMAMSVRQARGSSRYGGGGGFGGRGGRGGGRGDPAPQVV